MSPERPKGAPPARNVAVFIDMENLFGGAKGDVTSVPIGAIVADVERLVRDLGVGSLNALVRAYANWGRADMALSRRELFANGVEPVQIFSFNQDVKNAADIEMVVDILAVATESPWVDVFVIVSGDGGFVPLIRRLHTLGKYAIVVATSHIGAGAGSKFLQAAADHFHVVQVPEPKSKPKSGSAPIQAARSATKPVTPKAEQARMPVLAPAEHRVPSVKEYQDSVHALVRNHPDVLVGGLVHGSRLGALLRERWPACSHKDFGYRGLEQFVLERCGLKPYRPPALKSSGVVAKELVPAGT